MAILRAVKELAIKDDWVPEDYIFGCAVGQVQRMCDVIVRGLNLAKVDTRHASRNSE